MTHGVTLEIADVLRLHGPAFLERFGATVSADQRRVLRDLVACRTSALGGHVEQCDRCGHQRIAYNSCRNRHCPKCQAGARAKWLDARVAELLPVPYFHVVFTLPDTISDLALQNKRFLYGVLFRAAAETLREIAADSRHLGAEVGFLTVLHTWGQNLMHHPHLHCVIPAGGISPDGSRWISCRNNFFLPVRVLSRVFRGKFIYYLRKGRDEGKVRFVGKMAALSSAQEFEKFLNASVRSNWVVYAKRPFGGPRQVLAYLARYTHRVAISNRRLTGMQDGRVSFRWKDYTDSNREKTMSLEADEFIRRFLLHVLPTGFVKIRHYGFLANRHRTDKVEACRRLINQERPADGDIGQCDHKPNDGLCQDASIICPVCHQGRMMIVELVRAEGAGHALPRRPFMLVRRTRMGSDSS